LIKALLLANVPLIALVPSVELSYATGDDVPVRVHARIAMHPWAKLWYYCRALDDQGSGFIEISKRQARGFFRIGASTLYEWLRSGRQAGAFRDYRAKGDRLKIWLGSLVKVCRTLNLEEWGTTATIALTEVRSLKSHAIAATCQQLQDRSRYAAWRSQKSKERKVFKLPTADQIFQKNQASDKPSRGQIPFLLHKGDRVAFVSKGFVPFGVNQHTVGAGVGRSERTVRRHLDYLDIERLQIAQSKTAYAGITAAATHFARGSEVEPGIRWEMLDDDWMFPEDRIRLFEPNGLSSARKQDGHVVVKRRFFNFGGKCWLLRTNIYNLQYSLRSMAKRRDSYKILMGLATPSDIKKSNRPRRVRVTGC